MGIEEGTFWDEHWVLYGNQFDNKLHILKKNKKINVEINPNAYFLYKTLMIMSCEMLTIKTIKIYDEWIIYWERNKQRKCKKKKFMSNFLAEESKYFVSLS